MLKPKFFLFYSSNFLAILKSAKTKKLLTISVDFRMKAKTIFSKLNKTLIFCSFYMRNQIGNFNFSEHVLRKFIPLLLQKT